MNWFGQGQRLSVVPRLGSVVVMVVVVVIISFFIGDPDEDYYPDMPMVEYQRITASQALAMMDGDIIILDVRTAAEFEEIRIEHAVLIPYTDIEQLASELLRDKNQVILVYCRAGRRSEIAANILINMGYTRVYDFGGIDDWPYETVFGGG